MTNPPADAQPRWLDDREQAAWRAFLDMQGRLLTQLNRDMQDRSGLSSADFAVLVQLSEQDEGPARVLALARSLAWEKSRLSHQLRRMEQRGLIERAGCDADRRGAYVTLTAAGRAALEQAAPAHVESVRRYVFDGVDAGLLEQWAAVSRQVLERLSESGSQCVAARREAAAEAAEDFADPESRGSVRA